MVAVTGPLVALAATKDNISPVPDAGKPIEGVLLVQSNTMIPPETGVVKLILVVAELLQTVWLATGLITGGGFTVMVKLIAVPTQLTPPLVKVGVTVMVATTGTGLRLTATKLAMLPLPLAGKPIEGRLFVQL